MYRITAIDVWPGPLTQERRRPPFRLDYARTNRLLERELIHIAASNVALRCAVSPMQIRQDGRLYANAKTAHPGVILCFDSAEGAMSMPCDTFDEWLANLHAIAVALEDLRRISRYGVGQSVNGHAQYKGWTALAPPIEQWSKEAAREFLQNLLGMQETPTDDAAIAEMLRRAERQTHPDVGGNPDHFKRVQVARKLLLR